MNLAIVEFCEKNHHSMIFTWIKIAETNNWNITLYTKQDIFKNVQSEIESLKCNIKMVDNSIFELFKLLKSDYKNGEIDLVLYLSITCGFFELLFARMNNIKYGITIHNCNVWFKGNIIRKVSHILKRYVRYNLKKNALFYVVNSENMRNFIQTNFEEKKKVYVIPFSLRKSVISKTKGEIFTVVYPGSINTQRKKYANFIRLAREFPEDLFIVLGTVVNNKDSLIVYDEMKNIQNIIVYDTYVSNDEFNIKMKNANLLFSELVTSFELSDMKETYGVTKDSGISYQMIEYNLPALLNKEFINIKELESGSVYFENYDDLKCKYIQLKKNGVASLSKKIEEDLKNFNIKYFANSVQELENL